MDLSRIARGGTPLQLDRPRLLFYDAAAAWLLLQKYGDRYLAALYSAEPAPKSKGAPAALVLQSIDALIYFLWVGLQADCKLRDEEVTLDQVEAFVTPRTYPAIFNAVIVAIMRDTFTPPREGDDEGKADAVAARPAVAAMPGPSRAAKASTSRRRSVSRSPSSAGRPSSSGQTPSRSSTSPVKGTSPRPKRAGKNLPTG